MAKKPDLRIVHSLDPPQDEVVDSGDDRSWYEKPLGRIAVAFVALLLSAAVMWGGVALWNMAFP